MRTARRHARGIRALRLLGVALLATTVAGCASAGSGGDGGDHGNDDGSDSVVARAPDLSTFPGGTSRVPALSATTVPNACRLLTPAMVRALIPAAGKDAKITTPRSSSSGDTVTECQYLASDTGGEGHGNIIISFFRVKSDAASNTRYFGTNRANASSKQGFKDYGATLGAGSSVYYDPTARELLALYHGEPFTVTASPALLGTHVLAWRDRVEVPIVRNLLARMNG